MEPLSPTARVILGMVAIGRRTGYEIKALVDRSTAFFWSASYGQIYPELKRLEARGLLHATGPAGSRRRTEYELTADGEQALRGWLTSTEEPLLEVRDEAALKLFFADLMTPGQAAEQAALARRRHERILEQLREIQAVIDEAGVDPRSAPYLSLLGGIAFNEFVARLYGGAEDAVAGGPAVAERRSR